MTIAELIDEETARLIGKGDRFDIEEVYAAVIGRRSEIEDDTLDVAIWASIRRRDKSARKRANEQLTFDGHSFPEVLVVGKTERQPSPLGLLGDVLRDQEHKETNALHINEAMQEIRRRNLAILPFLEGGLTVEQAIEAMRTET